MSSLVIVYHRQPYEEVTENGKTVLRENKSPNGIVPTLKSFFGTYRGKWVAWKKAPATKPAKFERHITVEDSYGSYRVVRLGLTPDQISDFYHVTSKEALWPILHSFPWMFDADRTNWASFRRVNELFAEGACEEAEDDDVIWVHDYNLWLVPAFVRKLRPGARIAFFHHTPFPAPDIFNILPWREEIIDSLLACDIVGFHIPRYSRNFVDTVRSLRNIDHEVYEPVPPALLPPKGALCEPIMPTSFEYEGRKVRIDSYPIGTNPPVIREFVESETGRAKVQHIRNEIGEQKLIVSVGRVDYVKGTRQMLEAFERLLERRPELIGKVKLFVTSVSAADGMKVYKSAQSQIEQMVGRINGRFATLGWTPIWLFFKSAPFEEVVAYYGAADICWTTPLRDGLNLVAKEFIATHEGKGGVLVLSEFTGVAAEIHDAVLTNPYSRRSMDAAIDRALDMSPEEQVERMRRMNLQVQQCDVAHWAEHVVSQFRDLIKTQTPALREEHPHA